ncbi:MAG: hypothetical protein D6767_07015 [Candidatus Hydrogenedentota bacterium]|nr:MAG: hypothetical protein D6767_07015 [Candidatus Hydrogenedentota bacterium]
MKHVQLIILDGGFMKKIECLKSILLFFIYYFVLIGVGGAMIAAEVPQENDSKQSDLARVAILRFLNVSHSKDHQWVENSLPDAINISMVNKFEFMRTDPKKVAEAQSQEKVKGGTYTLEAINRIAKKTNSDILIYGDFKLSEKKDTIIIHAVVYNAAGKKVIGTVTQESELTNRIFKAIDIIAEGIVQHIYRYALRTEEIAPDKQVQTKKKKLRLLVLVPSYKTKKDKEKAMRELEQMKHELNGKYDGEFITIFEYYDKFRVPDPEREKINTWAKHRKTKKIIGWLVNRGVKDAFIILVRRKKVSITPVVKGEVKEKVTYKTNAKLEKKKKALAKVSKIAEVSEKPKENPEKKEKKKQKITLKKSTLKEEHVRTIRFLASGIKSFGKLDSYVSYFVGGQVNASFPFLFPWLYPYFSLDAGYGPGKKSVNNMWFAGAKGGIYFPYLRFSKFRFAVFAAAGAYTGQVQSKSLFLVPVADFGNIIDFSITSRFSVSFSLSGSYLFDQDAPGISANAYLGVGYNI